MTLGRDVEYWGAELGSEVAQVLGAEESLSSSSQLGEEMMVVTC